MNWGPSRDGEAGFTLVELVVCLGLLALMTGLAAEGLSLVRRGKDIMDRVEAADQRRAVETYLRRTIERATPLFAARNDGSTVLYFTGKPDRLRLVSRSNRHVEGGGLVAVEIRVDEHDGRLDLVTGRRPISARAGAGHAAQERLLAEGIEAVRFRYFGRMSDGTASGWLPEWTNPTVLPRLIEVEVVPGADGSPWTPLTIEIPAAEPTS